LARLDPSAVEPSVHGHARTLVLRRRGDDVVALALHFGDGMVRIAARFDAGSWEALAQSSAPEFGGPGATVPASFTSDGEVELELAPWSAVVARRVVAPATGR
jgi:hypothetical protein